MKNNNDTIIAKIETSFRLYNLGDIKKISMGNHVIASFILCSCFIEQISGYRYARSNNTSFINFVKEYMPQYNPKKLRDDLRNRLVHNYSIGSCFALIQRHPEFHLKPSIQNTLDQKYLNLENFIEDIEIAFNKFIKDLKENDAIKNNAINWFMVHKVLEHSKH